MASLSELIAADKRMTDAEAVDLAARGFRADVIEFLQARGFREAGARNNLDRTTTAMFLRQTRYPYLFIPLEVTDDVNAILDAIAEAAFIEGCDHIATLHQKFMEAVQRPRRPSETQRDIEQRLNALEDKLLTNQEQRTKNKEP